MADDEKYTLDRLIAALQALRTTDEDGITPVVLDADSWTINDYVEIEKIERQADRIMIYWN